MAVVIAVGVRSTKRQVLGTDVGPAVRGQNR